MPLSKASGASKRARSLTGAALSADDNDARKTLR